MDTTQQAKTILAAMAKVFTDTPERWTFGAGARNAQNEAVDILADDAYSFSVHGFLERAMAEKAIDQATFDAAHELLGAASMVFYGTRDYGRVSDMGVGRAITLAAKAAQ